MVPNEQKTQQSPGSGLTSDSQDSHVIRWTQAFSGICSTLSAPHLGQVKTDSRTTELMSLRHLPNGFALQLRGRYGRRD